jgi:hypothetical protein
MLCSDVAETPDVAAAAAAMSCDGWTEEMQRRGVLKQSVGLRSPSDATTIRVRNDQVLMSDGPFAETKDQIGGYSLIECADLDEAIEVASKHPWAGVGQIELRPLWEP